jgi:hypothetical protein
VRKIFGPKWQEITVRVEKCVMNLPDCLKGSQVIWILFLGYCTMLDVGCIADISEIITVSHIL